MPPSWHTCSALCGAGEHVDLVFGEAAASPRHIAHAFAYSYGVHVLRTEPATEAPSFAEAERMGLAYHRDPLTSAGALAPRDDVRVLVYWEEPCND